MRYTGQDTALCLSYNLLLSVSWLEAAAPPARCVLTQLPRVTLSRLLGSALLSIRSISGGPGSAPREVRRLRVSGHRDPALHTSTSASRHSAVHTQHSRHPPFTHHLVWCKIIAAVDTTFPLLRSPDLIVQVCERFITQTEVCICTVSSQSTTVFKCMKSVCLCPSAVSNQSFSCQRLLLDSEKLKLLLGNDLLILILFWYLNEVKQKFNLSTKKF